MSDNYSLSALFSVPEGRNKTLSIFLGNMRLEIVGQRIHSCYKDGFSWNFSLVFSSRWPVAWTQNSGWC